MQQGLGRAKCRVSGRPAAAERDLMASLRSSDTWGDDFCTTHVVKKEGNLKNRITTTIKIVTKGKYQHVFCCC